MSTKKSVTSMSKLKLLKQKRSYHPLAAVITLALSTTTQAATFTVTNTNDSGAGSLRQAVIDANGAAGTDEIVFSPALTGQNIILAGPELSSTDHLTIKGSVPGDSGSITINGGGNSHIISSTKNLTLENMTFTGGVGGAIRTSGGDLVLNDSLITGNSGLNNSGHNYGSGGIGSDKYYSSGDITLNRTTISSNTGRGININFVSTTNVVLNQSTVSGNKVIGDSNGGGIFLHGLFGANLTLNQSTVSNNSINNGRGRGGGIFVTSYYEVNVNINQSTISGNTVNDLHSSASNGGGIAVYGYYKTFVTLNQSTVFNNSITVNNSNTGNSNKAGGIFVGSRGFRDDQSIVTLVNSIVSGNSGTGGNIEVTPSPTSGNGIFATNSLFGDSATELAGNTSNIFSNIPRLGTLKNNGGLTETHRPNSDSPALDKGDNGSSLATFDQRGLGFPRKQNGNVDIGSVEYQTGEIVGTKLTLVKSLINDNNGRAVVSDFTLSASGPTPINGKSGTAAVTNVSIAPGTYTLTETTLPGYKQTNLECVGAADTNLQDGLSIAENELVLCTFTNDDQPARLTLVKSVVNDGGGQALASDFLLSVTSDKFNPETISGYSGSPDVMNIELDPGRYSLSEVTILGYEQIGLRCTGTSDNNLDDGLTLSNGEIVTCTFINTDLPVPLSIFANIINDDGGKAKPGDWELQVNGPVIVNRRPNSSFYSLFRIPAGTYTLNAINGPDNYKVVGWECNNGLLNGNKLTLNIGSYVSCSVTIDDQHIQSIPTLSLAGLLGLIASFAAFFGWRQRKFNA